MTRPFIVKPVKLRSETRSRIVIVPVIQNWYSTGEESSDFSDF